MSRSSSLGTKSAARPWRTRSVAVVACLAAVLGIAACGSKASVSSGPSSTAATAPQPIVSSEISASTRMICASEAQEDLSATLGSKTVSTVTPAWRDEVYSCTYQYVNGAFKLSVKQLPNASTTAAYAAKLGTELGRVKPLTGLGQGAFTTKNGSVVVTKDDKVLLVDVQRLPAMFGVPSDTRANDAISIAATIMGCWTGA
jgi:type IV pilus biogenesis protein CpaD/CtpE